jgi:hypothetical protein
MSEIVCAVCEKREAECTCTRYCIICMGQHDIRLCSDGSYYCQDCRDACEVSLANRIESH